MAKATINSVHSVSYAQLETLLTQIAGNIAFEKGNITSDYKALIGELGKTTGENPVDHTVVSYIAAKIAEVNGSADALEDRVEANESAIEILNGASTVEGSVAKQVADAIAGVIDGAPAAFDTLKEIAAWIGSGEDIKGTTAATMLSDITKLKGADNVEGSVAYAVKQLADGAVKTNTEAIAAINNETTGILKSAKDYADGLASNYDAAGTAQGLINALAGSKEATSNGVTVKVETSKGEVSKVEVTAPDFANTYDSKGAAAAVQGSTENTVKDLEDAINGFSYLTEGEMTALKALFPTSAE